MHRKLPSGLKGVVAALVALTAFVAVPQQAGAENPAAYQACLKSAQREIHNGYAAGYLDALQAECREKYGPPRERVTSSGKCRVLCRSQEQICEMKSGDDCAAPYQSCMKGCR